MNFAPIPDILEDIRLGRMVVIVDDEDRENEGDLIMAAELVKASDINFMVTHGRGLVCLPLTAPAPPTSAWRRWCRPIPRSSRPTSPSASKRPRA
jgi:hypothetical protein